LVEAARAILDPLLATWNPKGVKHHPMRIKASIFSISKYVCAICITKAVGSL